MGFANTSILDYPMFSPPFTFTSASVTEDVSETLIVLGGSGPATLVLDFGLMGQGIDDTNSESSASMTFSGTAGTFTAGTFTTCPPNLSGVLFVIAFACSGPQGYQPESASIPVTFGVPFSFTEHLTISVSGIDASFTNVQNPTGAFLVDYSVLDQGGNSVDGASLAEVPEPASFLLMLPIFGLIAWRSRKFNLHFRAYFG
jgi:hypothetical protein